MALYYDLLVYHNTYHHLGGIDKQVTGWAMLAGL